MHILRIFRCVLYRTRSSLHAFVFAKQKVLHAVVHNSNYKLHMWGLLKVTRMEVHIDKEELGQEVAFERTTY